MTRLARSPWCCDRMASPSFTNNVALYPKLSYDPEKDLVPLSPQSFETVRAALRDRVVVASIGPTVAEARSNAVRSGRRA